MAAVLATLGFSAGPQRLNAVAQKDRNAAQVLRLSAQSQVKVPAPPAQGQPPRAVLELPQVTTVPPIFLGCWNGTVTDRDISHLVQLGPPRVMAWLTKRYRICLDRKFPEGIRVTFVEGEVAPHALVEHTESQLVPILAHSGTIVLSGKLQMVERTANAVGAPPEASAVVEEVVRLTGRFSVDGTISVSGRVRGFYNSRPWWVADWNTKFRRDSEPDPADRLPRQ